MNTRKAIQVGERMIAHKEKMVETLTPGVGRHPYEMEEIRALQVLLTLAKAGEHKPQHEGKAS